MSAINSERPAFPPASRSAGAASSQTTAAKALRDAQAAFFRPMANAPAETATPAAAARMEPVKMAPAASVTATRVKDMPVADRANLRPGSLLDIRI